MNHCYRRVIYERVNIYTLYHYRDDVDQDNLYRFVSHTQI